MPAEFIYNKSTGMRTYTKTKHIFQRRYFRIFSKLFKYLFIILANRVSDVILNAGTALPARYFCKHFDDKTAIYTSSLV